MLTVPATAAIFLHTDSRPVLGERGCDSPRATHLPIYRQQDLFAGSGWIPSRSTLLNILEVSGFAIRPLAEHVRPVVLASHIGERVSVNESTSLSAMIA